MPCWSSNTIGGSMDWSARATAAPFKPLDASLASSNSSLSMLYCKGGRPCTTAISCVHGRQRQVCLARAVCEERVALANTSGPMKTCSVDVDTV